MGLTFDDSTVKDMLAASFLAAVPREKQEELLRQSIAEILKKDSGYRIQQLYREVVSELAVTEATKLLTGNAEFKKQFERAVQDAIVLAFKEITTHLPKFIGEAVARSLRVV